LHRMQQQVAAMEYYVAAEQRPLDECLADVAASDIYIAIVAWRYGSVPKAPDPNNELGFTELEYREARRLQKPCLVFLLDQDAQWPPNSMDSFTGEAARGERVQRFREALATTHQVAFFTSPTDLALKVGLGLFKELAKPDPGCATAWMAEAHFAF